jgi:hypothetical protein
MLDFSDKAVRGRSIGLMKEIESPLRPVFRNSLDCLLTEPEKKSQNFVDDLPKNTL